MLTGGIAHDFNNILGIVMGNLQLLRRQLRDDPARMEFVEMALRGVRRGAEITNKLLGFSSWEGNETTSTSINEIFDQMKELLAKSLTAATTIKIDLADNLWPADINAGDFEDAIVNLALNARDAMPAGGTLLITTANKVLDDRHAARNPLAKAGDFVMISMADTGTGMTAAVKAKAFEPFFTTKAVGKGTGLGLSMVYGFVERSGGHLELNTRRSEGTTFSIFLPRAHVTVPAADAAPPLQADIPGGTETVLVVDDEELLRDVAVALLQYLGYRTLTAANGARALAILGANTDADLLFCDVIMPGDLDGYQVALAAHDLRPDIKTLLTSGFTGMPKEYSNGDSGLRARLAQGLLSKPYDDEELALAVRRTLDGVKG